MKKLRHEGSLLELEFDKSNDAVFIRISEKMHLVIGTKGLLLYRKNELVEDINFYNREPLELRSNEE